MTGFYHSHGPRLAELGYPPVPIKPGTKQPVGYGWQKNDYAALLATPQGPRMFSGCGVGIKTKFTPAVDVDTPSEWLVEQVYDWCEKNIGPTIARIGRPPRELLVYRTDEPFRKVMSDTSISPDGNEHKVEILADGQQFVAYAIHPGTGKPYYWPDGELVDMPSANLPLMTQKHAFALVGFVNATCAAAGWTRKVVRQLPAVRRPAADPHAPLELLAAAMAVMSKYPETYDRWIAIGAGLHHATDGDLSAFGLWDTWSMTSDTYTGTDELYAKWLSFKSGFGAGAGTVFYHADRSPDRSWRERPDIAAMFEAYRAARRPEASLAGLAEKLRELAGGHDQIEVVDLLAEAFAEIAMENIEQRVGRHGRA
ncbi:MULTISPECIES: PriCT-2 domain-containing protein [unclassified Mesorhizobium]|uniref:PriCT-2 domain-containing protein n=1 Tax=unclassified Mesorhizobium TaxID=325217 RepID=UPI000F74D1C8|nr:MULTISPECIES: PriCT-2 domain-containing protein [unclassified Mesorhizobium]AZO75355.1 hypothetical protein EJ067_32395 [Mesorhizobium sp. M1D.F.Ca.ET.043.01.1.1]RWA87671.1 MAG: hypothetical protein EOQ32_23995 [Mesorhizobium sp.]